MNVFIIGAGGGVGLRLAKRLHDRGDAVTGMYRRPEQADTIAATGATPLQGDLITDSVATLAARIAGHDAVVFSAGAHGTGMDQTTLIDGDGLEKAVDAADEAGVARFLLVSAFLDAGRGTHVSETFEHYIATKRRADVYLAASPLDWLIVRPGLLTNDPGLGSVTALPAVPYGETSRDNVADFLAAALATPALRHTIIELGDGRTPIDEAIRHLTR